MHITGIYAALATLLVLLLAARVSLGRASTRIYFGDGGHAELALRLRAHANALENLPLALLLLLLLELNQTQPLWLHVLGILLIVARILHAVGLSRSGASGIGRSAGTGLTWLTMLVMALLLLWQWFVIATTTLH